VSRSRASFKLEEFGVDLTALARAGKMDPVIGRQAEIDRMVRILARKTKNNPLLLGEPGVGKTAVAEGLAQRIVAGAVPVELRAYTLFSLNLGSLLAGTGYRGDFEQRLQDLVAELRRPGVSRILFVDEIHLIGKAGKSEGGLDAGNLLKPLLARGELPCIGASTPAEWAEMLERDPALERRFQPVEIPEPTPEQTLEILRGLRPSYEAHHRVEITDAALQAAVSISVAAFSSRRLPDKAVDLLDEACAMLRLASKPTAEEPVWAKAQSELQAAAERFDLAEHARIKHQVLPFLQQAVRPKLEAASIESVSRLAAGKA
jgi:ATP-dependent Clp protease ATP-binding subunit ClpA